MTAAGGSIVDTRYSSGASDFSTYPRATDTLRTVYSYDKAPSGNLTSYTSQTFDRHGNLVAFQALDPQTATKIADTSAEPDSFGRLISSTDKIANTSEQYLNCNWFGPAKTRSADGTVTDLTYTPWGQPEKITSSGVASTYGYNAAGDVVSVKTVGGKGGKPPVTINGSASYDVLGRPLAVVDELERVTTYAYAAPASGIAHTTVTLPGSDALSPKTIVQDSWIDGRRGERIHLNLCSRPTEGGQRRSALSPSNERWI